MNARILNTLILNALTARVLDAFLREDVRGCVSRGRIVTAPDLPFAGRITPELADGAWLRMDHFGSGTLWLAVAPCRFMQEWRLRALPAVVTDGGSVTLLSSLDAVLGAFRAGLDAEAQAHHEAFAEECRVAAEHGAACAAERERWFAASSDDDVAAAVIATAAAWPHWAASLLRHDRLAAFHDHPFYPTARAKLGFGVADLAAWAPEFQPVFQLRWLAVPRALLEGTAPPEALTPRFADVGLPETLAEDHVPLPVHPAMWGAALDERLAESGLAGRVVRAPLPWMRVTPTLSVRTVAVLDQPSHHIKLPLLMQTLGARNIRTIKPSTIADGDTVQGLLAAVAAEEGDLAARLLLTREDIGASVAGQPFLGFILRRYPGALSGETVAPVAALAAPAPHGRLVVEDLADRHYGGDALALFDEYVALTLRLHLTLWTRYGIALESNQQNSMLVLSDNGPRLRLLLKDNDAARVHGARLAARRPDLAARLDAIQDRRILVDDPLALARMVITITVQLNIAVLVEAMSDAGLAGRADLYDRVRAEATRRLDALAAEGEDVALARATLLEAERMPLKYLLRAASLESKTSTGAADVNKFYGETAPNVLRAS